MGVMLFPNKPSTWLVLSTKSRERPRRSPRLWVKMSKRRLMTPTMLRRSRRRRLLPLCYLNKLVGITETIAGDVLKTMKKKNASPEAIQKYQTILDEWKKDLPRLMKQEEEELSRSESIETDETWDQIFKKYLPSDTIHVTEETKDKAANIDVQLIPARKQPMVAAMEAAGLTLPKREITQTRQKN